MFDLSDGINKVLLAAVVVGCVCEACCMATCDNVSIDPSEHKK